MLTENPEQKEPDEGLWFSNFILLKSGKLKKWESICELVQGWLHQPAFG